MRKMRVALGVVLVTACSIVLVACSGASTVSIAENDGDDSFGSGFGIRTNRDILDRSGIRAMGLADFDTDAANASAAPDSGAADTSIPSTEDASVVSIEDAGSPDITDAGGHTLADAGHGSDDAGSNSDGYGDTRWRRDRYERRW